MKAVFICYFAPEVHTNMFGLKDKDVFKTLCGLLSAHLFHSRKLRFLLQQTELNFTGFRKRNCLTPDFRVMDFPSGSRSGETNTVH
ncbi:MAG: hypothetical protein KDD04_04735, partial [Sinomicrobium sp.]|nr:hypothetical protein [Sinomicrobium sp.]